MTIDSFISDATGITRSITLRDFNKIIGSNIDTMLDAFRVVNGRQADHLGVVDDTDYRRLVIELSVSITSALFERQSVLAELDDIIDPPDRNQLLDELRTYRADSAPVNSRPCDAPIHLMPDPIKDSNL